jgi:hypothetical protein
MTDVSGTHRSNTVSKFDDVSARTCKLFACRSLPCTLCNAHCCTRTLTCILYNAHILLHTPIDVHSRAHNRTHRCYDAKPHALLPHRTAAHTAVTKRSLTLHQPANCRCHTLALFVIFDFSTLTCSHAAAHCAGELLCNYFATCACVVAWRYRHRHHEAI